MATVPAVPATTPPRSTARRAVRVAVVAVRLLLVGLLFLPLAGFFRFELSLAAQGVVVALFLITIVHPEDGLLGCVAFLTIGSAVSALLHTQVPIREPLLLAFLAACVLRDTVWPRAPLDRATVGVLVAAWCFAAVVVASALVQVIAYQPFADYPWPYVGSVFRFLAGPYVLDRGQLPGIGDAALVLEAVGLFVATVSLARRNSSLALRTLVVVTIGAVAVAALNVTRFAEICLRSGTPGRAFLDNIRSARISAVFTDVNAAGSYLAMMLIVAGGLAVAFRHTRLLWLGEAAILLAALWLSGSRAAFIAAPAAGLLVLAWLAHLKSSVSWRAVGVAVIGVVVSAVVVGWVFPRDTRYREMPVTVKWRAGQAMGALRAFRAYPLFGVGVGVFRKRSGEFFDDRLRQSLPRENAHNNYLQILAELGLAGFVSFGCILALVGRRAYLAIRSAGRSPGLPASVGGMLAFLLTCLVGHPLLVPEVAAAFWVVLGVIAALSLEIPAMAWGSGRHVPGWILTGAAVCLALSVPVRAHQVIENEADLGLATIGFSKWQFDPHGTRYRTMTGRAQFHVPGNVCRMSLGVQVDAPGGAVDVEVKVDDLPGNRIHAISDSWRDARIVLRRPSRTRRFYTIEIVASEAAAVLRTARPALADCRGNVF